MESKKYKLNAEDGKKVLKGAGIAMGGALLAYLVELLPMVDFGSYDKIAMVIGMLLLNAARKYLAGKKDIYE